MQLDSDACVLSVSEEEYSCEFGSTQYYALCGLGGILSCGITHTALVPLDLVKCRIQVNPEKYTGLVGGFKVTLKEGGVRELGKGWAPTAIGYSMQGLCKFGFYEIFKNFYSGILGEEKTYLWRTSLYLAASASAEFLADIALCPMEAVKVRLQTMPGWATTLREGVPKLHAEEGLWGLVLLIVFYSETACKIVIQTMDCHLNHVPIQIFGQFHLVEAASCAKSKMTTR